MESREDEEGALMLSKNKASKIKVWEEVSYAYHHDGEVMGTIVAKVKGGLSVDLGGIIAFLPGSQVDLAPMRHTDHLIGQKLSFKVLKFNRKRRNVVLSRRVMLEKVKGEAKATLLATLEEGKVLEGVVKNITDYGVFVDLGGLDGLLHITDLSYGRVRHPADLFKVGDTIDVKVLSFDREKERISLGLKQLTADPWSLVEEKFPLGSPGHRQGGEPHRLRLLRGAGAGRGRPDPHLRDVLDPQDPPSFPGAHRGRRGGSHRPGAGAHTASASRSA